MKLPNRLLVAPYKYKNYVEKNYSSRIIEITIHCPMDSIYYWNRQGIMRELNMEDRSIWTSIIGDGGWPTGYMRRIR